MNAKPLLLLCISLACFIFSSCQQHTKTVTADIDNNVAFREYFTGASKSTYAPATLAFNTGQWYLADALVASSKANNQDDGTAIRIRNNGKLSMRFDVGGAETVYIGYAVYAGDQPSDWQLWMSANKGKSYSQIGSTVTAGNNTVQKVAFDVNQPGEVRFEIRKVSGGKNRLLITSFAIATNTSNGTLVGQPRSTGQSTLVNSDNGNMLLGNPTNAVHNINSGDNYLIDHGYFVESYNKTKCTPNWVSWHIGIGDLGEVERTDNFRPDASLPGGWYAVDDDSYKGSGFDKGHNCPSADRTATTEANASTFFMDNIIPQAPNNNQHTWEHLESYCRDQVKRGNEVYVVMGNYGTGGTGSKGFAKTIDKGRINVPARIWKVVIILPDGNGDLARINNNTRVIAIDTPNDNSISYDWMKYVTTIAAIEKATGADLLSALPDNIESVLASKKYAGGE